MDPHVYERLERVLDRIAASVATPLSIADLASIAGMSEFHFARTFKRYVGTTPDRYARFLSNEYVRSRIRTTPATQLTYELGLSSPSRLSDLTVTFEALTPGQWANRGLGVELKYGWGASVFGKAIVVWSDRGIVRLEFVDAHELDRSGLDPVEGLERALWIRDDRGAQELLDRAFTSSRRAEAPLHLCLRGTNFQIKVWEALLRIPSGELASYQDVARSIGRDNASRAVGGAVGSNSIAVLIPCHRVVRKHGNFGPYRWGADRKKLLIAWEAGLAST